MTGKGISSGSLKPNHPLQLILHWPELLKRGHWRESYRESHAPQQLPTRLHLPQIDLAVLVREMRKGAGLTQVELAKRIRTTQSVIARLEDADLPRRFRLQRPEGVDLAIILLTEEGLITKILMEELPPKLQSIADGGPRPSCYFRIGSPSYLVERA